MELKSELRQMFEKAKDDEFEGVKLSRALILLAKVREQCEGSNLEEIVQEAGDLIAEVAVNIQERVKKRQSRAREIAQEIAQKN